VCHLWFWGISRSEMVEWLGAGWDLPEGLVLGAVPSEGQAAACSHTEGPGMAAGMTGCWRNFGGSVCKWLGCQGIPVVLMAIQGKGQIAVDDQWGVQRMVEVAAIWCSGGGGAAGKGRGRKDCRQTEQIVD